MSNLSFAAFLAFVILTAMSTHVRAEGAIAEADDPDGSVLQLTDMQVETPAGRCTAARALPSDGGAEVPACWSAERKHVEVLYLLHEGTTWQDEFSASEFHPTAYGRERGLRGE